MRIFIISFFVGASLAFAVHVRGDDARGDDNSFNTTSDALATLDEETLPMPLHDSFSSQGMSLNRTRKADMIHASRVERAKVVAAHRLEIELANRRSGIDTARPQVNSGYIFLLPPRANYRWFGPGQPTYNIQYGPYSPYGLPIH